MGEHVKPTVHWVVAESTEVYGPFETTMTVLIPLIAMFLVWYSKLAESRSWIS